MTNEIGEHSNLNCPWDNAIELISTQPDYEMIIQDKDAEIAQLHDEKENYKSMCEELAESLEVTQELATQYMDDQDEVVIAERDIIKEIKEVLTKWQEMRGE